MRTLTTSISLPSSVSLLDFLVPYVRDPFPTKLEYSISLAHARGFGVSIYGSSICFSPPLLLPPSLRYPHPLNTPIIVDELYTAGNDIAVQHSAQVEGSES